MTSADADRVESAERLVRIESSIDGLRTDLARYFAEHQDHEARLRELEKSDTRQNERLDIVASLNAVLTLVASAVAGWLGSRQ